MSVEQATSADGSVIGFEVLGSGPPMVLVHGGTADRNRWNPVKVELAERFTLHVMDRRGRGLSVQEKESYDLDREAEDVRAVIDFAGGDAYVVAHSFGAICALRTATMSCAGIDRMLLYEPPITTAGHDVITATAHEQLTAADADEDRERSLTVFFREVIELPTAAIDAMRPTPMWRARLEAAHTLLREAEAVLAYRADDRLSSITIPVRLLTGTESPHYYRPAAEAVAHQIPGADIRLLTGQAHLAIDLDPRLFIDAVVEFADGR
jgi:pimeloyl-ACP methyl ester carboxylesterase